MSEEREGMGGEDTEIRGDGSLTLVVLLFSLHSLSKNSHLSSILERSISIEVLEEEGSLSSLSFSIAGHPRTVQRPSSRQQRRRWMEVE